MSTITHDVADGSRYWWVFLVRTVLFLATGLITLSFRIENYVDLHALFGVTVLLGGLIEAFHMFSNGVARWWPYRVLVAFLSVIFGFVLMINIGVTMAGIPILLGIWFIFLGLALLSFLGVLKDAGSMMWVTIGGTLIIMLGLVIWWHPPFGVFTVVTWTAVAFITTAVINVVLALRLKGLDDTLHGSEAKLVM